MPGLVRKLLVFAAVDGLILQPLHTGNAGAVKVGYKGAGIGPVGMGEDKERGKGFEAFGIVGLLSVSPSASYLISITRREQVAQIHGRAIYMITEVALTPLSCHKDASASVKQTVNTLQRRADGESSESDSEDDIEASAAAAVDDVDDVDDKDTHDVPGSVLSEFRERTSSIAEDVMARRGGYGRFAQKWFSKDGWMADRRRGLGLSLDTTERPKTGSPETAKIASAQKEDGASAVVSEAQQIEAEGSGIDSKDVAASLLPKLLRSTSLLFGSSGSFFFSYDYDITRSFGSRNTDRSGTQRPLYKDVDTLFFWNKNVIQPFIDAGQPNLVLPLLQGFVGQREFKVDLQPAEVCGPHGETYMEMKEMTSPTEEKKEAESFGQFAPSSDNGIGSNAVSSIINTAPSLAKPYSTSDRDRSFLMTLISRRSVKRAGLRYLRRGVDEYGNTANSVETEQILSSSDWSASHPAYSFVQIRGSIPVFFSQSPYSFKPVPQMMQSEENNFRALKKHFSNLSAIYGGVQVVSLVEKHGNEAIVGEQYGKYMTRLNESGGIEGKTIGFEWFDFHSICRGMKFENVSLLLDTLGPSLDSFSYSIELNGQITQKQTGVLRTNCMDCLDRTNVVESACGRRALELQLKAEGIDVNTQQDQNTQWFDTLWADNGDAISKQYASTAALKGDFTRTRKRNYKGALTDMGLSISRFYSGIVNDYFSQAAIDFLVGNVTSLVFSDFESSMNAPDPSISVSRMRQQAIDASHRLIVADETEELIGGWAVLAPHEPNTIKSMPFEECVLLLTNTALYACRFDSNMEKVSSFERVGLQYIKSIKYGTYITSTLSAAQADERSNVGLVVTYTAAMDSIHRVNTRSLSSAVPASREDPDLLQGSSINPPASATVPPAFVSSQAAGSTRVLAVKALPARSAVAKVDTEGGSGSNPKMSEVEQVQMICGEIERLILTVNAENGGQANDPKLEEGLVKKGDIISLADARKSTGLFEQLGHSLKKLVWA